MAKRALIVDDSDASRDSLSFALKQKGFEVTQAVDGEDGMIQCTASDGFDLIITDINMPRLTGLEMVKKIRTLSKFKFTPIIVLSSEEDVIKDSIAAGASAWIPKSSKMSQQLVETIHKLVP
ncbi:MAG: response regulator [Spirochaetales bacterium]|nr:response regulator [Spirochaetales bacterium]